MLRVNTQAMAKAGKRWSMGNRFDQPPGDHLAQRLFRDAAFRSGGKLTQYSFLESGRGE